MQMIHILSKYIISLSMNYYSNTALMNEKENHEGFYTLHINVINAYVLLSQNI